MSTLSIGQQPNKNYTREMEMNIIPKDYPSAYPEFLPDPKIEWRNLTKEKLERTDMLNRR